MLTGLKKGKAHYKEEYLLEHLLELLSEHGDAAEPVSLLAEGAELAGSKLQGSEPQGESLLKSVKVPEFFREQVVALFSKAVDEASLGKQLAGAWEGTLRLSYKNLA